MSSIFGFFGFCQKFNPLKSLFYPQKCVHNSVLYDSAKPPWKSLVFQLWPKMLSANQMTVLSDYQYLWKESIDLSDFCVDIIIKEM